jgi:hypothetical protein
MMSLTTTSLVETVKNQYFFKLKANIDSFSSLVGIQILAMLFSLGGVGSSGFGGGDISVNVKYYSSDMIFAFTMIWAFITAVTITTKPYRNYDFSFVTNRLSSSLSNILFLGSASLLGAVTSVLSGNLLQVIASLFLDEQLYHQSGGPSHFILGISITFFYLFLTSAIGYLVGALVQISKLFVFILPGFFIGSLFLQAFLLKEPTLWNFIQFYTMETTVSLFILKTVLTTLALFTVALNVLNRLEVRR